MGQWTQCCPLVHRTRAHSKPHLMWWDSRLSVVRWYIVHVHTASHIRCGGTVDSVLSAGTLCTCAQQATSDVVGQWTQCCPLVHRARAYSKPHLMWWDSELNVVLWYIVHVHTASYIGCGWTVNSMLSSDTLCTCAHEATSDMVGQWTPSRRM